MSPGLSPSLSPSISSTPKEASFGIPADEEVLFEVIGLELDKTRDDAAMVEALLLTPLLRIFSTPRPPLAHPSFSSKAVWTAEILLLLLLLLAETIISAAASALRDLKSTLCKVEDESDDLIMRFERGEKDLLGFIWLSSFWGNGSILFLW